MKIFVLIDVFSKKVSIYSYIIMKKHIFALEFFYLYVFVWGFELKKVIECSEIKKVFIFIKFYKAREIC